MPPKITVDERRVDSCRRNAVTTNLILQIILRYRIRHRNDGTFTHGVGETVLKTGRARDRCHVQDYTATVGFHLPDRCLHAVIKTFDINLEDSVEVGFRGCFEPSHVRYASVIDKNLYTFLSEQLLDNCFDVLRVGHITQEGTGITSGPDNLASNRLRLFFVNVQDSNTSAAPRKPLDDSAPDPTGASSDDGNFAVQAE